MAEPQYSIVFQGQLVEGVTHEQAHARLMKAFSLDSVQAQAILARTSVVLKRGLSEDDAFVYMSKLRQLGLITIIDPPLESRASAAPAAQLSMEPLAPGKPAVADADGADDGGGANQTGDATVYRDDEPRELQFEFTGNGAEYFKIWIVNVLLSIVTLSLYSAWAKVRTMRYFYGNTQLDGSAFEYLADPIKIFKGRMIATVFLVVYTISEQIGVVFSLFCGLALLVVTPWAISRSLHFRARYSAWRGVRFQFRGTTGGAGTAFLVWYFFSAISLGLLSPIWYRKQMQYVVNNMHFGGTVFENSATNRDFYMVFLKTLGIIVVGGIVLAVLGRVPLLGFLLMIGLYAIVFAYFKVQTMNLRYDGTVLGQHVLQSDYELKSYFSLVLVNTLGLVFTLGLFYPFAKVRTARYAAEHTSIYATGDLGEFLAQQAEEISAVGSEVDDLFDIDVGF
jgi:uncharacterized membrane protein YjgN (DUF898 family)